MSGDCVELLGLAAWAWTGSRPVAPTEKNSESSTDSVKMDEMRGFSRVVMLTLSHGSIGRENDQGV